MTEKIDTTALLSTVDIIQVIERYVQLKKNGAEYEACCPFHSEKTPSFKVSQTKQFYNCFGCGANGDAIKFLQEHQGLSFKDAVSALGGTLPAQADGSPEQSQPVRDEKKRVEWKVIMPVPPDAPEYPKAHIRRGKPEMHWEYKDQEGHLLGVVYRFNTSDGGKEVLPCVYAAHPETGTRDWHWLSFPVPRPLYGLNRLRMRKTKLVVEGERCADAAFVELEPWFDVLTWPGGGKAVSKADWSPFQEGDKVIIWPDCDDKRDKTGAKIAEMEQPGWKAALQIADILSGFGCETRLVEIPKSGEKPDGWDVADAVAEGLTGEVLRDWIVAHLREPDVNGKTQRDAGATPDGEWRNQLLRKDDRLIDCRENVYLMLRYHPLWAGVLWLDDFARRIVKRKPAPWDGAKGFVPETEWAHEDDLRLGLWLAQRESLLIRSQENLAAAVAWVATESRFHPVRDYLDALVWDKVPRTSEWMTDYLGVKRTEYAILAARLFLVGMVARIYQPGCQMRFMPILEGAQFKGKSSALRILGGEWFGDTTLDLNNKDAYQLIQGCWLHEIGELDAFNRTESTRMKAFVSSQVDRFRAPYERSPRDWPRQTVFVGTTNQDEYFKDTTGNTRYWPLRVEEDGPINLDGLATARNQLFAEAVALYKQGERWHPTRDEQQRLFEPEQADREIADPWQSLIARWLHGLTAHRVSATEIITDCLKIEPGKIDSTRQMSTRVGISMKRLGWIKKRDSSGDREYYYVPPDGWIRGSAVTDDHGGGHV